MSQKQIRKFTKNLERALNRPIDGTGARVLYVALPGRGLHRREVTRRATQVLEYLERYKAASARELQRALKVNRNVISGAVFELRTAKLIRSQAIS